MAIELYQFRPLWGLPNFSPFCMKLETYLRLAGLPYEVVKGEHVFNSPSGKLPYIRDRGRVVTDSSQIIDYLKAQYGDPLDERLTPAQRATALAFQRLVEESLYWAALYSRWLDARNWPSVRQAVFGHLSPPLRRLVPAMARAKLRRDARGQGIGRHGEDELYAIGCHDVDAVATALGEQPYFLGDAPTSIDATMFGFLANLIWVPLDSPIKRQAAKYPQLDAYCRRMWARCFAERPLPPAAQR